MINRERNEGTLSKLLSQPIYRDRDYDGFHCPRRHGSRP
jgi:hypothetical protein